MSAEQFHRFFIRECFDRIDRVFDIGKASAHCLLFPFFRIAVAVEDDAFMFHICSAYQFMDCSVKIFCLFQFIGKFSQFFRNDGIQRKVGTGNRTAGRRHTEFKLVTCKSKRRSSVSVCCIFFQGRQCVYTDTHFSSLQGAGCFTMFDLIKNILQLIAQEDRNDGRRCFLRTQTVVIAGIGSRKSEQFGIFIYTFDDGAEEYQELGIFMGCFTGIQQIHAIICAQRPVIMLTGTIYTCKRFFMQQTSKTMVAGNTLHGFHD